MTRAKILPLVIPRITCRICGTFRLRGETWAAHCLECQRWLDVAEHMAQAAKLLREVR